MGKGKQKIEIPNSHCPAPNSNVPTCKRLNFLTCNLVIWLLGLLKSPHYVNMVKIGLVLKGDIINGEFSHFKRSYYKIASINPI